MSAPEIIPPLGKGVRIVAAPHPLRLDVVQAVAPAGMSIAEMLGKADLHAHVWIGDHYIPREQWARIRPKPGTQLTVRVIPAGKGILRPLLMIAVAVAAIAAPYALGLTTVVAGSTVLTTTGMMVAGAVGIIGNLAINMLIPPPTPKAPSAGEQFKARASLTGTRNQVASYSPIPRLYGTHRMFPPIPLTARPYTELVGSDQYLRMLVCLGYGPLQIGGKRVGDGDKITHETTLDGQPIRIGETPIHEFEGVEFEVGDPADITLFTDQVEEIDPAAGLDLQYDLKPEKGGDFWVTDNVSAVRTTGTDCDEISLDVTFPAGLFTVSSKGRTSKAIVEFKVEISPTGEDDWTVLEAVWSINYAKRETVRVGKRWTVERGQYDVRVTRLRTYLNDTDGGGAADATWSALRTIRRNVRPFTVPGTVVMAVRVKATDQLNGFLDTLNVVATSLLSAWNGSAWVEQATSNPAWVYADILTGTANKRPAAKSRLVAEDLADWAAWCEANGWQFNGVLDSAGTVFERARDVAAAGRAAWAIHDGRITVVRDTPQTTPVAVISPRNSWGFRAERAFPDRPHALQVAFIDARTWDDAVRTVYDDGYDATNATKFERLETVGVTDPEQAWKIGRYHLAQLRLRPEIFHVQQDIEHIVYRRGDLVRLAHDVLMVGLGWGRVKSVTTDGSGHVTAFISDEELLMEAGKTYAVRIRRSDGTQVLQTIQTVPGAGHDVVPTAPIPGVSPGDLFLYGESGRVDMDCKVTRIEPRADMSAEITLVAAAPEIEDALTGVIPEFDPQITIPVDPRDLPPRQPVVESVRSDETVLIRDVDGSLRVRMVVAFRSQPGVPGLQVEARYREQDGAEWRYPAAVGAETGFVSVEGVEEGIAYEVQLRSRSGARVSPWSPLAPLVHTVIGKTSPPHDIEAFTATLRGFGLLLSWQPVPDPDLSEYVIRAGADWDSGVEVGRVKGTTLPLDLQTAGTHTFLIKAVDVAENESVNAASASITIAAPAASGLSASFDGPDLVLQWSATAGSWQVAEYEIRRGPVFATASAVTTVKATSYRHKADWGGSETWWVAPIDVAGNVGNEAGTAVAVALPSVATVTPQVIDNNVLLRWAASAGSLPIDRYELRRGDDLATAEVAGGADATFAALFESSGGAYTYWVVPIDSAGNEGTARSVTVRVDEPPDFVLRNRFATEWGGTASGILPLGDGDALAPFPAAETVADRLAIHGFASPQAQIDAGFPYVAQPVPASAWHEEEYDAGAVIASTRIVVSPTAALVASGASYEVSVAIRETPSDPWVNLGVGGDVFGTNFRYVRVRIDFASDGKGFYSLDGMETVLRTKIRNDAGTVMVSANPTPVLFNVAFLDIQAITLTPVGTTAKVAIYDFVDEPFPTGFEIHLFDAAGNPTTGEVGWQARGF